MTEKLTYDLISKSHEKYENVKIATVKLDIDGEIKDFELEMYKIFSQIKIQECIYEFIENIDKARKKNKHGFGDITEPYIMWLMIKHFTELGESMPVKFEEQIASLRKMIETSSLFQIMLHFDVEEVKKVKEELEVMLATYEGNREIFDKLKEKSLNELKDKSLLEQ